MTTSTGTKPSANELHNRNSETETKQKKVYQKRKLIDQNGKWNGTAITAVDVVSLSHSPISHQLPYRKPNHLQCSVDRHARSTRRATHPHWASAISNQQQFHYLVVTRLLQRFRHSCESRVFSDWSKTNNIICHSCIDSITVLIFKWTAKTNYIYSECRLMWCDAVWFV